MDIQVTESTQDDNSNVTGIALTIEPQVKTIVTTADTADKVDTSNAVVETAPVDLGKKTNVTISIPLPNNIHTENLKIKHIKSDGTVYYYDAEVDSDAHTATFTVTHGFSDFVLTNNVPSSVSVTYPTETKTYQHSNVVSEAYDKLETASKSGYAFKGWKFDGISGTFTEMNGTLYNAIVENGNTAAATAEFEKIAATGISLDKDSATLNEKETLTLAATVEPTAATAETVEWTSTNTAVATVENGIATAITGGTATIQARIGDSLLAECVLTVNHVPEAQRKNVSAATCAEEGYTGDLYCENCSNILLETGTVTAKLSHTWDDGVATTAASCTQTGVMTYTCIECDETKEEEIPATGHSFGAWQTITAPNCTSKGGEKRICSICGYTETRDIDANGHNWNSGYTVDKTATCTENGSKSIHCKNCNAVKDSVIIPATGHKYQNAVTDPTCTERGYTTHTCSVCKFSYTDSYTAAKGHSWDSGTVTKKPTVTETGVKTYTCTTCNTTKTEEIGKLTNNFEDVPADEYYAAPVSWAVSKGVTNGTSSTTFSPTDICIREQVVTFLWRAKGSPEPRGTNNPFSDVFEGDYYYKAVLWAVENGITSGTSATTFSPSDGCTRAQVATFLWRAENKPSNHGNNPFVDVPSEQWYSDAVLWAVDKGITNGTSATTFEPDTTCTRGQIVTFLYRDMA